MSYFERVTDTLQHSLIEAVDTAEDAKTDANQYEKEVIRNEQLVDIKMCNENKFNSSKRQTKVPMENSKKHAKGLHKSASEVATKVIVPSVRQTQTKTRWKRVVLKILRVYLMILKLL
ncbi:hypothetical protein ACOME3_009647 [Neoechinorhynchus agilis]